MKDEIMNNYPQLSGSTFKDFNPNYTFCKCGEPMIFTDHIEWDGIGGSYEPYWECTDNKCQIDERSK